MLCVQGVCRSGITFRLTGVLTCSVPPSVTWQTDDSIGSESTEWEKTSMYRWIVWNTRKVSVELSFFRNDFVLLFLEIRFAFPLIHRERLSCIMIRYCVPCSKPPLVVTTARVGAPSARTSKSVSLRRHGRLAQLHNNHMHGYSFNHHGQAEKLQLCSNPVAVYCPCSTFWKE